MSIALLLSDFKVRALTEGDESQSLGNGAVVLTFGKSQCRWDGDEANGVWRVAA